MKIVDKFKNTNAVLSPERKIKTSAKTNKIPMKKISYFFFIFN